MITKILDAVKAQKRKDVDESEKYLTTKKWEWSFLRVSLTLICQLITYELINFLEQTSFRRRN